MQNDSIEKVIETIMAADDIAVVTHVGPDGDASGSSLALGLMLGKLGKRAKVYVRRSDLGAPAVMSGTELFSDPDAADLAPGLLVCLDCATPARISVPGFRDKLDGLNVLNIDHHESNDGFGKVNYVVADASSTGELVWRIARAADWEIDQSAAEALWVAIVTDTGRFSYSCTHPSTLECGADLLRRGVRQDFLNDEIFSRMELRALRLRARAYASLETWMDGKVAVIHLDVPDYLATGCRKADSEEFVNIPRAVRGASLAIFFYRSKSYDDATHLSIRAREPLSASALAERFGGGGHRLAAGATIKCGIEEAMERVRKELPGLV